MKATTIRRTFLVGALLSLLTSTAVAQSYYDDDIYYDANKAKKEKAEKERLAAEQAAKKRAEQEAYERYLENLVDTEAGSERNVDEYNRRNGYVPQKEQQANLGDNFTYTRRIEQFSNPGIVVNSNDDDLKYLYTYANDELAGATGSTSPTTINIYVDNTDPWDNFWSPYYYTSAWSWAWRPAYYNPWWGYNYWNYGPSWSWSWNWGPSWGPSWSWNWGWHPGPSWGWTPPHPPHHPVTPPHPGHRPGGWGGTGVSTTHGRPANTGSSAGRRPAGTRPTVTTGGRRQGISTGSTSTAGRRPSGSTTYNPSNATRPSNSSSSTGGATYQRGGTTRSSSSSGSYNSGRSSSSSSGSYNSGRSSSSSSGRSSGGSYSGGGRSSSGSGRSGGGRR